MYNQFLREPGGVFGGFPENPTTADYERDVIPKDREIPLAIILVGIIFFFHVICLISCCCSLDSSNRTATRNTVRYCMWSSVVYIMVNIILLYLYLYLYQEIEYNVCSYPFDCEEGENDTIVTSNLYYAVPKDTDPYCPTIDHMISYYLKVKDIEEEDCVNTVYGCCEFSVNCFFFSEYDYLYSDMKSKVDEDMSRGLIMYNRRKLDIIGSNCEIYNGKDSIVHLIDEYLDAPALRMEMNILIYLSFYILFYIGMISCFVCTTKEGKKYNQMAASV